jgi:hypothetical protein
MGISFDPFHLVILHQNPDGATNRTHKTQTVNFLFHELISSGINKKSPL